MKGLLKTCKASNEHINLNLPSMITIFGSKLRKCLAVDQYLENVFLNIGRKIFKGIP
jgi:hypothetical protein